MRETQKGNCVRLLRVVFCLGLNNQDPAVHNLLLALYSKETDDAAFIRFLEREGDVFYDLKYALRLCVERGKKRPCVLM